MFGRATITLGIGPHSSSVLFHVTASRVCSIVKSVICPFTYLRNVHTSGNFLYMLTVVMAQFVSDNNALLCASRL